MRQYPGKMPVCSDELHPRMAPGMLQMSIDSLKKSLSINNGREQHDPPSRRMGLDPHVISKSEADIRVSGLRGCRDAVDLWM